MRILSIILASLLITGCASKEYAMYAETQKRIAESQAMAETAKYAALAEIAKTGDSAAKVAAVMSINFGGSGNNNTRQQVIAAPESFSDKALKWTGALLPSLVQFYSIGANRDVAVTQSNNSTQASIQNSKTMENIVTTGFKSVQAPQPNVTTTIGGNYNTGTNSGNSGKIVSGNLTEQTAVPTVVNPVVVQPTTP